MIHPLRASRLALVCCLAACAPHATRPAGSPSPDAGAALTLESAPDQFFTRGDIRIRYRTVGAGVPVVLLHGFTRDLSDWRVLADSLARDYRVIAPDWRGFGLSSKPTEPARYGAAMLDDVAWLMDHLGIRSAHVVGHSMGANAASGYAVRYPDQVRTLTLVAGIYGDQAFIDRMVAPKFIPNIERRTDVADDVKQAWLAVLRNAPPSILAAQTSGLRMPVLAVVGSTDEAPLESARELARAWPQLRVTIVEGADHGGVVSHPELVAAVRAHLGNR